MVLGVVESSKAIRENNTGKRLLWNVIDWKIRKIAEVEGNGSDQGKPSTHHHLDVVCLVARIQGVGLRQVRKITKVPLEGNLILPANHPSQIASFCLLASGLVTMAL